jgi:hypothetical protein
VVDNNKFSDQEDFEFVQNLFDQVKPELASPELKADILLSAPSGNRNTGFAELIEYLWPFGALWRPAAGLAMAAVFGIMLGLTDPLAALNTTDIDEALTEEIVAFTIAADGQLEDL